jgi:hypothetical protein
MHVEAFMPGQPAPDVGMFVSAVVVGDHVKLLISRSLPVAEAKERNPVLIGMLIPALT